MEMKKTGLDVNALRREAGARKVTEIIVHCSATPAGRDVDVDEIRRWHVKERGFVDVGYHFVVKLDGSVEAGRSLALAGAHCKGHNRWSVGVCYVGGLDGLMKAADTRTVAQRDALKNLVDALKGAFPGASVYGHRDVARKDCPCFDAHREYADE